MNESLNSEEHRAQLAERRGKAHGKHVKQDSGLAASDMYDEESRDLQDRLLKLETQQNSKEAASSMPKPRFDSTINTGHILTMLTIVIGFLLSGMGAISAYKDQQQAYNEKFNSIMAVIAKMQVALEQNHADIESDRVSTKLRTDHYAPLLEASIQANKVEDERLNNIAGLVATTVNNVAELARSTAQMDKGFAVLQAQLAARGNLPTPRGQ